MKEIWKDIPRTNGMYAVSNLGRVASKHNIGRVDSDAPSGCHILKQRIDKYGYCTVSISANSKENRVSGFVHRLVMLAFVGESNLQVNHINEIKTDNRLCNLEYVTNKQNTRYSQQRPVERYDLETGDVRAVYCSITAAGEDGYNMGDVHSACNGRYKSHAGYGWRYHKSDPAAI